MSETVLIRGGSVVTRHGLVRGDVIVADGRVSELGEVLDAPAGATVIDADGAWVGPGFVDLHAHLREPGREEAETIESGAAAAALGGYTAILAMPNTEPTIDSTALATYVIERGRRAVIDVVPTGAITVGRLGTQMAPIAEMAEIGVRLFTDDGTGVQDPSMMRRALTYAKPLGVRLAQHCEDEALAALGSMNEGALSSRLGLLGRPALAEELMVIRDVELVRLTGGAMHFLHLSTARSLQMVALAKAEGLNVTCEVAPHHFTLDEELCASFDPLFKVHPPLRGVSDVVALRSALLGSVIDAVATDHAPHAEQLKELPFDEAPPGMLGLEHAAALTHEALGADQPVRLFELLSRGPAAVAQLRAEDHPRISGEHGGVLEVGSHANIVVFDPQVSWRVDARQLASRSTNTPYEGREMRGRVRATIVAGHVVVANEELQ